MTRIQHSGRPWVNFDSNNKEHRRWFAEFQRRGNWSACPVRFILADDAADLVTMIQRRLIEYYVNREFNKERQHV